MQLLVYYQKHFTEVPNEWRDSQISNECGGIFKISWIWRKFWINMSKFSQVILFFERIVVFWWYSSNRIWCRKSSVEAHVTPKRERDNTVTAMAWTQQIQTWNNSFSKASITWLAFILTVIIQLIGIHDSGPTHDGFLLLKKSMKQSPNRWWRTWDLYMEFNPFDRSE